VGSRAVQSGGTRNKWQKSASIAPLMYGQAKPKPELFPDLDVVALHGQNAQVLCEGCNLAKSSKYFVPDGKGYAYSRSDQDLNPDNRYSGPPKIGNPRYF
jgi:hypothetical protein